MRFRATALTVVALALSATFAGSAVAVPNVVDQYTEQFPTLTGPSTTLPERPDSGQQTDSATGRDQNSGPLDSLSASGAPVPPGASPDALGPAGEDSGELPGAGSSTDLDLDPAGDPRDLPGAQPSSQTETGGIGSGMGIVFPAILLLITVAAVSSLLARRSARGQAGQD